jgi:hypothetical protein
MLYVENLIKDEIQLAEDECCIVFDFGCYFPYSNPEVLVFDFSLGMETIKDYKLNKRYSNKCYQTISRKYGRKVSKVGYPYVMKINEQATMLLSVRVGVNLDNYEFDDYDDIDNHSIILIFPLQTTMTVEKRLCLLTLNYKFDENEFYFRSYGKTEDYCICNRIWKNYEENSGITVDGILLNPPVRADEDSNVLIYDNVIEPFPLSIL